MVENLEWSRRQLATFKLRLVNLFYADESSMLLVRWAVAAGGAGGRRRWAEWAGVGLRKRLAAPSILQLSASSKAEDVKSSHEIIGKEGGGAAEGCYLLHL